MTTVRQMLLKWKDEDATAAADLLAPEIQNLDLLSGCGNNIIQMFQHLRAYLGAVERTTSRRFEDLKRWELWSMACETAAVMYFG